MKNTAFAYSGKENLPNDKRLKAIVIWPEDDPVEPQPSKDKPTREKIQKRIQLR